MGLSIEKPRFQNENDLKTPEQTKAFPTQEYIQKRMYFLFSFVRRMYMCFSDPHSFGLQNVHTRSFQSFEAYLCELLMHYAQQIDSNTEPSWAQEDTMVYVLMQHASAALQVSCLPPYQEVQNILLRGIENTFNKSDGYYEDYPFGSTPAHTFWDTHFTDAHTGQEARYSMQASGGLLELSASTRSRLLRELINAFELQRNGKEIIIWGNITRGIFDAALIYNAALQAGLPVTLRLYRYSSHVLLDTEGSIVSPPPTSPECWHIAVDSLTAGGKSVVGTKKLLETFGGRASMFLTFLGSTHWGDQFPVLFCFRPTSDVGTLLDFS